MSRVPWSRSAGGGILPFPSTFDNNGVKQEYRGVLSNVKGSREVLCLPEKTGASRPAGRLRVDDMKKSSDEGLSVDGGLSIVVIGPEIGRSAPEERILFTLHLFLCLLRGKHLRRRSVDFLPRFTCFASVRPSHRSGPFDRRLRPALRATGGHRTGDSADFAQCAGSWGSLARCKPDAGSGRTGGARDDRGHGSRR